MAHNQTGIFIGIKAFLPIGRELNEQLAALTMVKDAHESGDYSALLAAATVDDVKTQQITRRVEDTQKVPPAEDTAETSKPALSGPAETKPAETPADDADVPEFLKQAESKKKKTEKAEF